MTSFEIRAFFTFLALTLMACGGNTPPPQPPVANVQPIGSSSRPEPPPLPVEYVVIHRKWVEKFVPTPAADVKAWAEAPENAEAVPSSFRHIVIVIPPGTNNDGQARLRKKGQGILDRLKKGEDFAKLAKQLSEDAASGANGGEVPAAKVMDLEEPVRKAFAELKPGETSTTLVQASAGLHVIKKERASDDRIERAYKKAKAPELTKKLADDLLKRLANNAESRPAIADAVQAVLGEGATNDVDRPISSIVERQRLKQLRLSAAAKAALETFARSAHPGDLLPSPAVDGDTVVVARALAAGGGGAAEH